LHQLHEAEPSYPLALAVFAGNSRVGQDPFGEAMNPVVIAVFCRTRCCVVLQSVGSPTDLLLSCDSISSGWRFGWLAINQHPHPLQLFLVESLRSLSPYQERSIAQLSKELTGFSLAPDQPNQLMRWHSTNELTSHTN
jgi:hypothetical protein